VRKPSRRATIGLIKFHRRLRPFLIVLIVVVGVKGVVELAHGAWLHGVIDVVLVGAVSIALVREQPRLDRLAAELEADTSET
jgi:hypothetical protein